LKEDPEVTIWTVRGGLEITQHTALAGGTESAVAHWVTEREHGKWRKEERQEKASRKVREGETVETDRIGSFSTMDTCYWNGDFKAVAVSFPTLNFGSESCSTRHIKKLIIRGASI
jgi:hypothetical protein